MDFAFPALIILFLSFPGILFFVAYFNIAANPRDWVSGFGDLPKAVAGGILFALVIHLIALSALHFLGSCWPAIKPVNMQLVLELMGEADKEGHNGAIANLAGHYPWISGYILLTCAVGYSLGRTCRNAVRKFHVDVIYPFFQMENQWTYFFSGENEMAELLKKQYGVLKLTDLYEKLCTYRPTCYVSLLVNIEAPGIIINGVVEDYEFDDKGDLDRIVLSHVSRMNIPKRQIDTLTLMSQDADRVHHEHPDLGYAVILGSKFVVPYSEVKNMNTVFFFLEKAAKNGGAAAKDKATQKV